MVNRRDGGWLKWIRGCQWRADDPDPSLATRKRWRVGNPVPRATRFGAGGRKYNAQFSSRARSPDQVTTASWIQWRKGQADLVSVMPRDAAVEKTTRSRNICEREDAGTSGTRKGKRREYDGNGTTTRGQLKGS